MARGFPFRLWKSIASKEGVSLKGLADLCDILKVEYTAAKVSIAELCECPLPCILHWNQNHFVVLYRIDRNGQDEVD